MILSRWFVSHATAKLLFDELRDQCHELIWQRDRKIELMKKRIDELEQSVKSKDELIAMMFLGGKR